LPLQETNGKPRHEWKSKSPVYQTPVTCGRTTKTIFWWSASADDAPLFEHGLRAATLALEIRKPFDVLAEGLLNEKSRGDWTPLELFVAGVREWGSWRWRQLEIGQST
jgi:hypothetical protein